MTEAQAAEQLAELVALNGHLANLTDAGAHVVVVAELGLALLIAALVTRWLWIHVFRPVGDWF